MSLRIAAAAIDTYDALKRRPRALVRRSDARRPEGVEAVQRRINELVALYRIGIHAGPRGETFVFWSEIQREVDGGAFDDLLDTL